MDAKVFRLAILTILSAFILVAVIIYATNADKIGRLLGNDNKNETSESVSTEEAVADEASYGQQIGDDLKAFLYDDDFFDETEEVPAVVVIQQNTKVPEGSSEEESDASEDEEGAGMAVVGQLDNPDAPFTTPDGMFPGGTAPDAVLPGSLTEPPIEGTPVGVLP